MPFLAKCKRCDKKILAKTQKKAMDSICFHIVSYHKLKKLSSDFEIEVISEDECMNHLKSKKSDEPQKIIREKVNAHDQIERSVTLGPELNEVRKETNQEVIQDNLIVNTDERCPYLCAAQLFCMVKRKLIDKKDLESICYKLQQYIKCSYYGTQTRVRSDLLSSRRIIKYHDKKFSLQAKEYYRTIKPIDRELKSFQKKCSRRCPLKWVCIIS
ncbi:MAG: hypothetical protein QW491_13855 [Thermoproteota archaeon]